MTKTQNHLQPLELLGYPVLMDSTVKLGIMINVGYGLAQLYEPEEQQYMELDDLNDELSRIELNGGEITGLVMPRCRWREFMGIGVECCG